MVSVIAPRVPPAARLEAPRKPGRPGRAWIFKEGFGPRRLAATAIVFAGVLLINLA
jgi:drug/metabolite transporter (DMT)-like permease